MATSNQQSSNDQGNRLIIEQGNTMNGGADNPSNNTVLPPANNNRFGAVRDRLFHVMLVKVAISYSRHVSYFWRRVIEFSVLIMAISLLGLLFYVHFILGQFPGSCLSSVKQTWPRKGVVRVEVIQNLEEFHHLQAKAQKESNRLAQDALTHFDLRQILIQGPVALPKELKAKQLQFNPLQPAPKTTKQASVVEPGEKWKSPPTNNSSLAGYVHSLLAFFYQPIDLNELDSVGLVSEREPVPPIGEEIEQLEELEQRFGVDSSAPEPLFVYVVEYSLHYGLLKLSPGMRQEYGIPSMLIQLDSESDECFGDWKSKFLMRYLTGFEDIVMSSVRSLAENETEKGYLRDMISGEHYHFVSMGVSRVSYLTALLVMLIFTFAISMLLRFSHHQIFLFIVDLLQMFELNQPLVFPIAPLLTVILALVGMEAIMSEIFNDTSTAFYVILLVWMADQYDAICCHSSIGKRYWLRFFYLYHFAFYAYQYRFNGLYGGLALFTSAFFIFHSMIFFFHHYEMPLIVYQERLQRIVNDLQHNNNVTASTTLNVNITLTDRDVRNATVQPPNSRSNEQSTLHQNRNSSRTIRSLVTCTIRRLGRRSSAATEGESSVSTLAEPVRTEQSGNNPSRTEETTPASADLIRAGQRAAEALLQQTMGELFSGEDSTF